MEWDRERVKTLVHEILESGLDHAIRGGGRMSAEMNGITPEDAQHEIHGIVKAWLTQAKANAFAGAYKPTVKQCGG